ncbi:uncharacterized protein GIQ15_04908 [Arthroderma uncinatum]|uniref:uncharacterized protein n=1 Tax=Arthroderma uncinatum TaxID=74035 RepID=UPI00144A692E|nr:uncharacterized protein GIQ15_04908 [Arthroderma uncinatum]KAF3482149.1 hypothetical protein GIQ15_04908 [Arthroderma uncinatum]
MSSSPEAPSQRRWNSARRVVSRGEAELEKMMPAPLHVIKAGLEAQRVRGIQPAHNHPTAQEVNNSPVPAGHNPSRAAKAEKTDKSKRGPAKEQTTSNGQDGPSSSRDLTEAMEVPIVDAENEQSYYHVPNLEGFDAPGNDGHDLTFSTGHCDNSDERQSSTPVSPPAPGNGRMMINFEFANGPSVTININQDIKKGPEGGSNATPTLQSQRNSVASSGRPMELGYAQADPRILLVIGLICGVFGLTTAYVIQQFA